MSRLELQVGARPNRGRLQKLCLRHHYKVTHGG
jgi:hypothetical protein